MGVVYKCVHVNNGTIGAVKFIDVDSSHTGGASDEQTTLMRRFQDESKAVSSMDTPHVVHCFATGCDPELGNYIIMEFLPGSALEERLKSGALPLKEFFPLLARPLLKGLNDLHGAGILHRDIKPSNLISGPDGKYKISDFGLAVFKGREAKTQTGYITGTPGYLAPELFQQTIAALSRDSQSGLFQSDIYSAGIVLIEAITGVHPFRSGNLGETLKRQMKYKPTGASLVLEGKNNKRDFSLSIASALAKAVSPRPEDRYDSAGAFLTELESAGISPAEMNGDSSRKTLLKKPRVVAPGAFGTVPTPPAKTLSLRTIISIVAFLISVLFFLMYVAAPGISPGGNTVQDLLRENLELTERVKDFTDDARRLNASGISPNREVFDSLYESGLRLASYISKNPSIPPSLKRQIWEDSTAPLLGTNGEILSRYISRVTSGGKRAGNKEAWGFATSALKEYRHSFIASFKRGKEHSFLELARYLDGELWLMEQVLLTSTFLSEKAYFHESHALVLDGEMFVANMLSSQDGALFQSVTKYRFSLSLWRSLIFSGYVPLSPWDSYRKTGEEAFFPKQYVALFDGAHEIIAVLRRILHRDSAFSSMKDGEFFPGETEKKLVEDVYALIKSNEECSRAVEKSTHTISSQKSPAGVSMVRYNSDDYIGDMDVHTEVLRRVDSRVLNTTSVFTALRNQANTMGLLQEALSNALVLGQRAIWRYYTLISVKNTGMTENRAIHSADLKGIGLIRSFLSLISGEGRLGEDMEESCLSPAMNAHSLPKMALNLAMCVIKGIPQEEIWPGDEQRNSTMVMGNSYYVITHLAPLFKDFLNLSSEKEGRFTDVLEHFHLLCSSFLDSTVRKPSLIYAYLKSCQLKSAGVSTTVVPPARRQACLDKAIVTSRPLFLQMKRRIIADGLGECPFEPHILLLREIIDLRWPLLRKRGELTELLAEAEWVQNVFDETIEEAVTRETERGMRAWVYCQAVANVGHCFLKNHDEQAFQRQITYIEKALGVAEKGNDELVNLVNGVLQRKPIQ